MKEWYLLTKLCSFSEASIVQGVLEENNIPVQMLNKKDSVYHFGDVEIYVPATFQDIAQNLLNNTLLN